MTLCPLPLRSSISRNLLQAHCDTSCCLVPIRNCQRYRAFTSSQHSKTLPTRSLRLQHHSCEHDVSGFAFASVNSLTTPLLSQIAASFLRQVCLHSYMHLEDHANPALCVPGVFAGFDSSTAPHFPDILDPQQHCTCCRGVGFGMGCETHDISYHTNHLCSMCIVVGWSVQVRSYVHWPYTIVSRFCEKNLWLCRASNSCFTASTARA